MTSDHLTRRSRALAQLQRDAALRRIVSARKWTFAAAAALAAGFSGLVSAIAPGHTLGSRARLRGTAVQRSPASTQMPPLASASELGLQGPGEAPQSAPPAQVAPTPSPVSPAPQVSGGGGAVVSGGS